MSSRLNEHPKIVNFARRFPDDEIQGRQRQNRIDLAYRAIDQGSSGIGCLPAFLREVLKNRDWEHERVLSLGARVEATSFEAFVAAPYPGGLGTSLEAFRRLVQATDDVELLQLYDRACDGGASTLHALFNSGLSEEVQAGRTRQDVVHSLYNALNGAFVGLKHIPIFLKEAFEKECWKHERILAGGGRQPPISFYDFVHKNYPIGLGSDFETLRRFITGDVELLQLYDRACQRGPNEERDPATGRFATVVDNMHNGDRPEARPAGTSRQAGLRRLQASTDPKARGLLDRVLKGVVSVNGACVAMGWRRHPAMQHADCLKLKSLEERWDDHALAGAIMRVMLAARRAADNPKPQSNPAEAARMTIMELERWAAMLKRGE
jgi:hypothetical protein